MSFARRTLKRSGWYEPSSSPWKVPAGKQRPKSIRRPQARSRKDLDPITYPLYSSYMKNASVGATEGKASGDTTIFSLLHAARTLEDKLESALATAGLSGPKFSVLSELVSSDAPLSLSDLAARLSCVRSNMTQLVDRLEAESLVQRVNCPNDRRAVKASITDLGRERQAAGAAAVARLHEEFAASVAPEDRASLHRLLSAFG